MAKQPLRFPGKTAIRQLMEVAKSCGLDVAGVELSPDGSIRVFEARAVPAAPADEFDRLVAEGKI